MQSNKIFKLLFSYIITLIQTALLSSVVFIFFAPFFMIMIIVQDHINHDISTSILSIVFLGKDFANETDLPGIVFIYLLIASILAEIVNAVFKIKVTFSLNKKLLISSVFFAIGYLASSVLFYIYEDLNVFIMIFFLIFSLLYSGIVICVGHILGKFKKQIK